MPHAVPLVTTLAAAFGLALILGFAAARLKLPALVGYLVAGVLIGPFTPGYVADGELAAQLAEIGVMLLMFGVGLHFSLADLLAVRRVAVPGAVVQMGVATLLGTGLALAWGWTLLASVVFGLALSVASTVVLLKALEARQLLTSPDGRLAVGWLVVEDLAMVLVLVLLPPLAQALAPAASGAGVDGAQAAASAVAHAAPAAGTSLWVTLGRTLLAVAAFVVLMLGVGRKALPWFLGQVARSGSRELFTLSVVASAVSIAYLSASLFGVSFALGAFFAGMVLRESPFSHRAAEESLPLRDAFAVLFFVAVGMLFNPQVLWQEPLKVLGTLAVVVLGKGLAAAGLVLLLRYPPLTAFTVAAGLAQVGEFSFILAGLGLSLGVLPELGQNLVLAAALLSMALNPLFMAMAPRMAAWVERRWPALVGQRRAPDEPLAELPADTEPHALRGHALVVAHGRLGECVVHALLNAVPRVPVVVVATRRDEVTRWREMDCPAVLGHPADALTLVQAHLAHARCLVLTEPDPALGHQVIEAARPLRPDLPVIVAGANAADEPAWAGLSPVRLVEVEEAVAQAVVHAANPVHASPNGKSSHVVKTGH